MIDRCSWGSGPWDTEPDLVEWTTQSGLYARILRHASGHWCGYVHVPNTHVLCEADLSETISQFVVHGNVSYCNRFAGKWWLGFDAAHYRDLVPGRGVTFSGNTYRDAQYMQSECESLAWQIKDCRAPAKSE